MNVYIKLQGGLGNQLFQVACGYAYAKKYGKQLILDDIGWSASQGNNPKSYRDTIFKNFEYIKNIPRTTVTYTEPRFNYTEIPKYDFDVSLSGYFQSLKYFEDCVEEFIDLLDYPKFGTFEDSVAVHVRRGDYLQHSHIHYVCDTDYFKRNLERFSDKKIHIFTDSKDFVSKEFWDLDVKIVNTYSDLTDMAAMAYHPNIICSNSSFSWWASLLGVKKDKIIVPPIWFKNYENHEDIYRQEFIKG